VPSSALATAADGRPEHGTRQGTCHAPCIAGLPATSVSRGAPWFGFARCRCRHERQRPKPN